MVSIDAATMQLLLAAGKDVNDLITVAHAMERGDDRDAVYHLIDDMQAAGATDAACGMAVLALAGQINATEIERRIFYERPRDQHSEARDSNRSRRDMPDKDWRELRLRIFERDDFACTYCGADANLTCDHVLALVRGGTNDENNLTTACRSCNSSKGDRLLEEWQCL